MTKRWINVYDGPMQEAVSIHKTKEDAVVTAERVARMDRMPLIVCIETELPEYRK